MKKKVAILGSTGSIGVNILNIIREFNEQFEVEAIAANRNIELIIEQVKEFQPKFVSIGTKEGYQKLKEVCGSDTVVLYGEEGILEISRNADYDIFANSLVGFAGLKPTIEAIKRSKRIAIANKETFVVAGQLVNKLAKKYNAEILPVDSEHSAIFQSLVGEDIKNVAKLILTASGGPFLNRTYEELKTVTIEQALNHPNWKMGKKITIDSSTLVNKALEIIEAHYLFNIPASKIDVLIHPQSIIHSMVEFIDGSIKAQLSVPDMKLPILYALSYPERLKYNLKTNLPKIHTLSFFEPDTTKFRSLNLAYEVLKSGGLSGCILNAANEVAVNKFLMGEIKYLDIVNILESALNTVPNKKDPSLEDIFECDLKTRKFVEKTF
ncbi:MAG TPA: 1-deoxy-D-xylulose-5-phosphate reductoisomerase [Ignavibacteriales bacterium]|nr:1-deoxy-D-xylulose-5-phosphate reductoisomerase [Ignavibacteriales bacterium]HOL81990.1 1-deoxy-D-xylulose-5-phosphate reductoisomerase [Ignavibacteriales bacterium]HOM64966.1 1-deoxy-D-xylulose-5-phosphate reductoisomerase [Ignavibacteriales bacterium]HPD68318.1 1-deoxy-D-xylulose-5-phosphate reductoisomerase [Ignavibacteriales bacterium]HPP34127.1 1-deoxy-D-xylulose-5-phosphate reductoisomerase [Ignavibacteriales bacterium]